MELITTVNIVVPPAVQAHAGLLHRKHQPDNQMKVPAHFTVLHPFVSYPVVDEDLRRLRRACAALAPIEITAEGYDTFPGVVFLRARDPEPIRQVSRALCAAFPECPLYEGVFGPELNPHVTIVEGEIGAGRIMEEMPAYKPVTFTARELHVFAGNEVIFPWLPVAIVPLGPE